jgi:DNA-binding beta-propeller fold protein YncE
MIPGIGHQKLRLSCLFLLGCAVFLLRLGHLRDSRTGHPAGSAVGDCCRHPIPGVASAQEHQSKPQGGDITPLRQVSDPYPVFNGIAVDPVNNIVAMSDVNKKSLLSYDRTADSIRTTITLPRRQVFGPLTNIGFIAGVMMDPQRREIFAVNNDIEDTMVVLPYDARGNAEPSRILSIPHQAWGVALSRAHDQIAITVELQEAVIFYRRDARNVASPLRFIRGANTGLADPHGVFWDDKHNEIGVANHGNFRGLIKDVGAGCVPTGTADPEGGAVLPSSITIYSGAAKGDVRPLRTIQGYNTKLDFPMGLSVDEEHEEFAVANNGGNSVLVFSRMASGDAVPLRLLGGDQTGINRPMGIAIDSRNDELWVSNFGDHTALVFDRRATGNIPPKRIIRTAPAGTPTPGFGNPQTIAYDGKRDEILVPN